jgi:hypothetical protein
MIGKLLQIGQNVPAMPSKWEINNGIEAKVEELCLKGCQSVREDIKLLQCGAVLPELQDFDALAREAVLRELQSIMAVYGDACPIQRNENVT